jgi:hypothetical protein
MTVWWGETSPRPRGDPTERSAASWHDPAIVSSDERELEPLAGRAAEAPV